MYVCIYASMHTYIHTQFSCYCVCVCIHTYMKSFFMFFCLSIHFYIIYIYIYIILMFFYLSIHFYIYWAFYCLFLQKTFAQDLFIHAYFCGLCMYACMHACMYVCMYVCMYAYMHFIYSCLLLRPMQTPLLSACMDVCMYACMHTVCTSITFIVTSTVSFGSFHVCMYAYMYRYVWIPIVSFFKRCILQQKQSEKTRVTQHFLSLFKIRPAFKPVYSDTDTQQSLPIQKRHFRVISCHYLRHSPLSSQAVNQDASEKARAVVGASAASSVAQCNRSQRKLPHHFESQ